MNFEISGGSYNPPQNTLRLINEFKKCILSFMESLMANFIHFSSTIARFLFLQGRLEHVCAQFRVFSKVFSASKSYDNS